MNYYQLNYDSLNPEITGTEFQSVSGYAGDIQKEFMPYEGYIDFDFALPQPILEDKAKLTSYLNVVMIPSWLLILNQDLINFLNSFNVDRYQSWQLEVLHKKETIYDYHLFILNYPKQREMLVFDKSEFYIGSYSDYQFKGDQVSISSYEDYLSKKELLSVENPDLFLKHDLLTIDVTSISDDFFRLINAPYSGYYVSERLKNAIEDEGFTGMTFQRMDMIDSKIEIIGASS